MTIDLTEDFEGSTSGTAISTSNTAFTSVTGSGVQTFDNAQVMHGALSMKAEGSGSTGYSTKTYAARNTTYIRMYFRLNALPASNVFPVALNSTSTTRAQLRIANDGAISLRNGTTAVYTMSNLLSAGVWYRLEWLVSNGTGQQLRIYLGDNASALEDSGTQTYNTGTHDRALVGVTSSAAFTAWYDDVEIRDDDWPGPVGSIPSPGSVAVLAAIPTPDVSTPTSASIGAVCVTGVAAVGSATFNAGGFVLIAPPTVAVAVRIYEAASTLYPSEALLPGESLLPGKQVYSPEDALIIVSPINIIAVDATAIIPVPSFFTDDPPLEAIAAVAAIGEVVITADTSVTFFYFTTPTIRERRLLRRHALWDRMYLHRGQTIIRFGSSYQQIDNPSTDQMDTADALFIGGRTYAISETEADLLRTAGYGHWVNDTPDEVIDEVDFSQYGTGPYGSGPYGA